MEVASSVGLVSIFESKWNTPTGHGFKHMYPIRYG
jgi:hypothetical protein